LVKRLMNLSVPGWRSPHRRAVGVLILLIVILAPVVSACSSSTAIAPTSMVRMGIVGASQPLWRYVAQQRDKLLSPSGYLATFISYNNETELRKAFLNNEIDVMATLPPQLALIAQDGVNLQYFLPIAWLKEGYPIVVPADSAILTPADLPGKRLSTFPSDHPGMGYWQAFVQANYGFRLADKTLLSISQDPVGPLLEGQADAATVDSVAWSKMKSTGLFRQVSDLATEWAKLSGSSRPLVYGGYVARKEWLDKNRPFVDEFIRVNYQALQSYQKDRKAFIDTAAAYAEGDIRPMPADILQSVADYLGMSDVTPERAYLTDADTADYDRIFQLLVKTNYLSRAVVPAHALFYLSDARPKG